MAKSPRSPGVEPAENAVAPVSDASAPAASFEAALAELEQIVAQMESGQVPLETSLQAYERGAALLKYCHAQLADAQQKVRIFEEETLKLFSGNDDQR